MITFPSPLAHYYTNINGEDRQIEAFIIMVWVDLTNYGDILVGGSLPNSILEEDIMVSFRISIPDYILIEEEPDEKYQLLFYTEDFVAVVTTLNQISLLEDLNPVPVFFKTENLMATILSGPFLINTNSLPWKDGYWQKHQEEIEGKERTIEKYIRSSISPFLGAFSDN